MTKWKLLLSIIICQLAGVVGSLFTDSISTWYVTLNKPFFTPPSWLFAPAWITLYLLMGISLYLVWEKGLKSRYSQISIIVFAIQLALNSIWSILFFGFQAPLLALIEIVFLWLAILASIFLFYRISKVASYLLLPYILWVTFAGVLNFSIYYLN